MWGEIMYFLNEEEKLYLHKSLIPESRDMYIDYNLRGWNWNQPPLEPIYDIKLGVAETANNYCSSNRDLYLQKVMRKKFKANDKMLEGSLLHKTMMKFITSAKKELYVNGIKEVEYDNLFDLNSNTINELIGSYYFNNTSEEKLINKVEKIWEFESQRVKFRMQEVLSSQPYIGVDALIHQVIPIVVEQKLNGSFIGLSPYLSTDAINFSEPMIVDTKFGKEKDFHKLSVTGYALVMESLFSFPVNLGCLVYPEFKNGRILIKRDLFIITDELRQKFIEQRDEKMRMIYEDIDPGISNNCYETCPFYKECN